FSGTSTLDLNGFDETTGFIGGGSNSNLIQLGSSTLTIHSIGLSTYNGIIDGVGGNLIIENGGQAITNNNNSFSGTITLRGPNGLIFIGGDGSLGAVPGAP